MYTCDVYEIMSTKTQESKTEESKTENIIYKIVAG